MALGNVTEGERYATARGSPPEIVVNAGTPDLWAGEMEDLTVEFEQPNYGVDDPFG